MNDLAEAWEEVENENTDENEVHATSSESDSADIEGGAFAGADDGSDAGGAGPDVDGEGVQPHDEQHSLGEQDVQKDEVASLDKPPAGLSPAAREVWNEVPNAVREHIAGYEKRMEGMAQKYSHDANRAQSMDKVLQPFSQLFAMGGGPQNVMPGLLQTASILQMGSPQQKADQVANLIKQFGVDIQSLDRVLVGKAPPPEQQQASQVEQLVNQRFQQMQQQQQQQAQQQQMQQSASEIQSFASDPKNEFYRDVRAEMADIMDMAANRGQEMSLQDAYQKACQLHPEVSKIVTARNSQAQVNQRRQAATSIHGTPGGEGGGMPADNMRIALEEAWNNSGRV